MQGLQQDLESANAEKAQLLQEKSDLLAKFKDDNTEVDSLKVQLEEINKVIHNQARFSKNFFIKRNCLK